MTFHPGEVVVRRFPHRDRRTAATGPADTAAFPFDGPHAATLPSWWDAVAR